MIPGATTQQRTARTCRNLDRPCDERDRAHVREVLSESGIHVSIHALPEDASVAMCRRTGSLLAEVAASKRLRKSHTRLGGAVAA